MCSLTNVFSIAGQGINLPVLGAEVAIPPKWRVNGVFWYVCVCDVWYEGEWCETHLHTQGMPLILGLFCSFMGLFLGLF